MNGTAAARLIRTDPRAVVRWNTLTQVAVESHVGDRASAVTGRTAPFAALAGIERDGVRAVGEWVGWATSQWVGEESAVGGLGVKQVEEQARCRDAHLRPDRYSGGNRRATSVASPSSRSPCSPSCGSRWVSGCGVTVQRSCALRLALLCVCTPCGKGHSRLNAARSPPSRVCWRVARSPLLLLQVLAYAHDGKALRPGRAGRSTECYDVAEANSEQILNITPYPQTSEGASLGGVP